MTPFTVEWEPGAEDELAGIWLQASDPAAVTRAQAQADQLLAQDPLGNGRHMSEGLHRIDVPPLVLTYTVNAKQRKVTVNGVLSHP
jgi:hypothetical protein